MLLNYTVSNLIVQHGQKIKIKITRISCFIQPTLHLRMRNTPPSTRAASSSPPTHQNIVAAGVPPQAPRS